MAKNSLLAKICDGPMFHLGTTGKDDDNNHITIHLKCIGILRLRVGWTF
jgi:hypothetical protein